MCLYSTIQLIVSFIINCWGRCFTLISHLFYSKYLYMCLLYIGVIPDFVEVWSSSFETEENYLLNVTADKKPFERVSYASISPVPVQSNSCYLDF